MTDYSLLATGDSVVDCLDNEIQAVLKIPVQDNNEEFENPQDRYLIQTTDGQLLWVYYSGEQPVPQEPSESAPAIFIVHSPKDQAGLYVLPDQESNNILTVSSFENLPDQDVEIEDDIDSEDILKVEDRVKVFDAILTPAEKKVRPRARIPDEEGENLENYVCDLCGSSFMRANQYYGHLHLHSGEFLWECQSCSDGVRFPSQSQLRRHEKKFHVNLRPHSCTKCDATFDRPSQLDYHRRRIHENERSHACQLCGKAFFKRSDLRTHLNTHLSVHGCMCEVCGRRFSHVSNLTRHMRIHSGVKPYPCSYCGRRFNQLNSLNEHKASHIGQTPITCCGKTFKSHVVLKKHVKLMHQTNGDKQTGNKRQFHCKVCGNSFPFLTLLRRHEMEHNQFSCSSCKKELGSLDELKNHSCKENNSVLGEYISDQDENDALNDMYLDGDTDWIDAQSISRSDIEKLDQDTCGPLQVEALTCDDLVETGSLSYTEVDKLVQETCQQVDTSPTVDSFDSLITPLPPSSPPTLESRELADETDQSPDWLDSVRLHNRLSDETDEIALVSNSLSQKAHEISLDPRTNLAQETDEIALSSGNNLHEETDEIGLSTPKMISTIGVSATSDAQVKVNEFIAKELPELINNEQRNCVSEDVMDGNINDNNNNSTDCNSAIKQQNVNSHNEQVVSSNPSKVKTLKVYTCSYCGKQFQKASNFKQHLGIHDAGRQLYRCKICGRSFAWKSTLNKHASSHPENPDPPVFPCDRCAKVYLSASLLQAHVNRDHLKQRPHKCSVCPKSFFKKYDLKIHFRTHTHERPYICETCGRRFRHISHLIRHDRIHSGVRPYQCSYCPSNFIQSTSLTNHQKQHTNANNKEIEEPVSYLEEFIVPNIIEERPKEGS